MPRKRKVREVNNENRVPAAKRTPKNQKIVDILLQTQDSPARHDKYIKELQAVYTKCVHEDFLSDVLIIMRSQMVKDINNEYANNILTFCAKFVAAYNVTEETHPIVTDIFGWLLETSSRDVNVRFRLCEFVNIVLKYLGEEAVLDDSICDNILKYMIDRINDVNANIRTQAVLALQRLQNPDDPNDLVLKQYNFRLSTDPSVKMRQAIVTSIGRNMHTMPVIMERLWDVDEKMRRHVILQMSAHPVRSYKVAERLTYLEQGLNDHSDIVCKATTNVMLTNWVAAYNNNYISFVGGLKLDTNDKEMQRFRKCAIQALQHIFNKDTPSNIVTALGFAAPKKPTTDDEDDDVETTKEEFPRCVPLKKLNIEVAVYWEAAVGFLKQGNFDELDAILPELSIFCDYTMKYCESIRFESDKWQQMKNQYVLLSLLEIIVMYDLGDEVGRQNLRKLLRAMVIKFDFDELNVSLIARILEQVYPIADERLQMVVETIQEILHIGDTTTTTIDSAMESTMLQGAGIDLQLKVSELKVKMMDLKEQENAFVQKKDYASAQKATEEWSVCNEEYMKLLQPLLPEGDTTVSSVGLKAPEKVTTEMILKCLQLTFYTIACKNTKSITPPVVNLYNQFICRHMDSQQAVVREWAFKCATSCGMLYSMLVKEVARTLSNQFVMNHNIRIWTVAIECLFELIDHYGLDFFGDAPSEEEATVGKGKKPRQLFSTSILEHSQQDQSLSVVETIGHLSHLLENCEHSSIVQALIIGFCRFVLHGHFTESSIVSKLMLFFFNPATEDEVKQLLGIFFESLTKERKQEYLQPALLPTLFIIFEAPMDSPLQEIKPEKVMKFVIDVTQPQYCSPGLNIHNTIGMSFLNAMQDNVTQKELLKVLSKGLLILEVSDDPNFRKDLKNCCNELLKVTGLDEKVAKNIGMFKDLLDGIKRPSITFSSTRMTGSLAGEENNNSDDDGEVPKDATLETITEEQNSILEDADKTVNGGEEILVPETPSMNESQLNDSVFISETQEIPETQETPEQSTENTEDSVIEASFDDTATTVRGRKKKDPAANKAIEASPTKRTLEARATRGINPKYKKAEEEVQKTPKKTTNERGKKEDPKDQSTDESDVVTTEAKRMKTNPKGKETQKKTVVIDTDESDEDETEEKGKKTSTRAQKKPVGRPKKTDAKESEEESEEEAQEPKTKKPGKKQVDPKPIIQTSRSTRQKAQAPTTPVRTRRDVAEKTPTTRGRQQGVAAKTPSATTKTPSTKTPSSATKTPVHFSRRQALADTPSTSDASPATKTPTTRSRQETSAKTPTTSKTPVLRLRREMFAKTPTTRGRQEEAAKTPVSRERRDKLPSTKEQAPAAKTPTTRGRQEEESAKTPVQRERRDKPSTKEQAPAAKTPTTRSRQEAAAKTTTVGAKRAQSAKKPSMSLSQSSSTSSVKSGPTTPKRSKSASDRKNLEPQASTSSLRTRRAAAKEFSNTNVITRKRAQNLSPSKASGRTMSSSQDSNTGRSKRSDMKGTKK